MNKFVAQGKIKQVNATILTPENAGLRFILNLCSQNGKFDSTLGGLLTKRWSQVRLDYKGWYASQHNFKPGQLYSTAVASDTWVVHMLVQDKHGKLDSNALVAAVKKLGELAKFEGASVHVSNLLADEAPALKDLLIHQLVENGTNVYFYNEPQK